MTPKLLSRIPPVIARSAAASVSSFVVRLNLDPALGRRGVVDGAWWPSSSDTATELSGLIAAVDQRLGRITLRVTLNSDSWETRPHRVQARGRLVEVRWLRGIDPHLISLTVAGIRNINLLVMAPGVAGAPTSGAFRMTSADENRIRSTDALATSHEPMLTGSRTTQSGEHAIRENEGERIGNRLLAT
ncbi:DUF5994 family protein [Streptosporangium sp. NPDC000396]|uniref:DUF5994 family protein n=1 Tax=Streptosporangium sp. NPDC000396 TaxID=3366185 RepID=UPI0036CDF2EA